MTKRSMKPGTMLAPTPAVLVSCRDTQGNDNLITIAWTGIINSDPPITYISVRKSRYSHHIISESGEFVINLTNEQIAKEGDFCGVRSGRDMDKFQTCGFTRQEAEIVSAPLVCESPVNLECVVKEVREYPTHDMFIAEIVRVHADETLFNEDGRLCLDKASLVAYSHGEYFGLKRRPLGRFGWSVMKPKTKKRLAREARAKRRKPR